MTKTLDHGTVGDLDDEHITLPAWSPDSAGTVGSLGAPDPGSQPDETAQGCEAAAWAQR